jgi:uncharacterized membrane protein YdjX (TVP38/TMEM64 family)
MRVLLTEGSGLTSRQTASLLHTKGYDVGVLSCDPIGLTRFTKGVRRWHRIGNFGADPLSWLDTALDTYRAHSYDLLIPTQEQVAVLSACAQQLRDTGVVTAVPSFASLVAVQDKIAAHSTLQSLELTQPESAVLSNRDDLANWKCFPVYIKTPIGTATSGVRRIDTETDLLVLLTDGQFDAAFDDGGVIAQLPVQGPLVMVQSVFNQGSIVAFHANLRIREGVRGGASHKRSIRLPQARQMIEELGAGLHWHGALSVDMIVTAEGPSIIDINPRLVEPMNAYHSGIDLVDALVNVAQGNQPTAQPDGSVDVNTHQLLLAILGAAEQGRGRRGIATELFTSVTCRGAYRDSTEELTPCYRDWRAPIPVALATVATLVAPNNWRWFATGSVTNYALTPIGWRLIQQHAKLTNSRQVHDETLRNSFGCAGNKCQSGRFSSNLKTEVLPLVATKRPRRSNEQKEGRLNSALATAVSIAAVLLVAYATWRWLESTGGAVALLDRFGPLAPLVSIPVHILLSATPFPSELIGIANGSVYGLWVGTLFSWIGWWCGALLEYMLVRLGVRQVEWGAAVHHLPGWLRRLPVGHPVFLIVGRQIPFGFHAVNVLAGLAGVSPRRQLVCSAISNIPYAFLTAAAGAGLIAAR